MYKRVCVNIVLRVPYSMFIFCSRRVHRVLHRSRDRLVLRRDFVWWLQMWLVMKMRGQSTANMRILCWKRTGWSDIVSVICEFKVFKYTCSSFSHFSINITVILFINLEPYKKSGARLCINRSSGVNCVCLVWWYITW